MKKYTLIITFALVALAIVSQAQEKKFRTIKSIGTRYANEKYTPRKYKNVFLRINCKNETELAKIVKVLTDVGLKVSTEKIDPFNKVTESEEIQQKKEAGYDGFLDLKIASEDTQFSSKVVNIEMNLFDISNNIAAVKYEIKTGIGAFDKGLGDSDKIYVRFLDLVMDDFRQYF